MTIDLQQELADVDKRVRQSENDAATMRNALPQICPHLETAEWAFFYDDASIIAGFKTRAAFAPVRALAQKWTKDEPTIGEQTYRAEVFGVAFIANVSELPPSCRVVEEIIEVPAREAHTETVRKLVCK